MNTLENRVSIAVGLTLAMEFVDGTAVNTSLPVIANSLHGNGLHITLIVSLYLLAIGLAIPLSSFLAERYSPLRLFRAALLAFVLASVCCGSVTTIQQMIAFRILQGMAAGLLLPTARLIVLTVYGSERMHEAVAKNLFFISLGMAVGPFIGGFLSTMFSWRWIFFLNVPVACVVFLLLKIDIVDFRKINLNAVFDYFGYLLLILPFTLMFLFVDSHLEVLMCLSGSILFYCFYRYATKTNDRLFSPKLLQNREFMKN